MATDPSPTPTSTSTNRRWIILASIVAIVVIAAGAFIWWFLRDTAPDEVSLDQATAQVTASTDTSESTGASATTGAADGDTDSTAATDTTTGSETSDSASSSGDADITGTWTVDTSVGEFSYEDATGSFVGFRIAEELSGVGATEAVGRTPEVAGTLVIDATSISEVTIEADMTQITTDDSRRDDKVLDALHTDEFPTATFTLTEPIELPAEAATGESIAVNATGDLTVNGITQSVTFPLEAQLVDDTIVVVGSLDISFAEFDVEVPASPAIISVDDHGPIELQLFFTR